LGHTHLWGFGKSFLFALAADEEAAATAADHFGHKHLRNGFFSYFRVCRSPLRLPAGKHTK